MKKIVSLLLIITMFFQVLPVYAKNETGFVSFSMYIDFGNDDGKTVKETGYTDGEHLYVLPSFLEKYTYYYYDYESKTFVRNNHASDSKFGSVEIHLDENVAVLNMNENTAVEYSLHNIYSFGDDIFLPLEQMAAFLKANVINNNNESISIYNSRYCLADAEYIMNIAEQDGDLLKYSLEELIEDIFNDLYLAYGVSDVLYYFSSTIFGFRIDRMYSFVPGGNIVDYKEIIENCVKDNESYLTLMSENNMETFNKYYYNLVSDAYPIAETMYKQSKSIKNISSGLKATYEMIHSSSEYAEDLMYIDIKGFSEAISGIATVLEWVEFVLGYASINTDNRNMLSSFKLADMSAYTDVPAFAALQLVKGLYSEEVGIAAITKGAEVLSDELVNIGVDATIGTITGGPVIPIKAFIKGVNEVVKLGFDYDLSKHYEGLVVYAMNTVKLSQGWYSAQSKKHFMNEGDSETYRLSALFYLLTIKEVYNTAKKLAEKYDRDHLYNDEIQKMETVIMSYYLAAQGKNFDNIQDIDNRITENHNEITKIFKSFTSITQEEALDTSLRFDSWEDAAIHAIYNAPEYFEEVGGNPGMGYRLMDITGDDCPEIFYMQYGGSGGSHIYGALYWTGERYEQIETDSGPIALSEFLIAPYLNTKTNEIEFYVGVIDREDFTSEMPLSFHGGAHFPYTLVKYTYNNDSFYTEVINKREYNQDNPSQSWEEIYNNEKEFMNTHILVMNYKDYYSDVFNFMDFYSSAESFENPDNYRNIITMSVAEQIVEGYIAS